MYQGILLPSLVLINKALETHNSSLTKSPNDDLFGRCSKKHLKRIACTEKHKYMALLFMNLSLTQYSVQAYSSNHVPATRLCSLPSHSAITPSPSLHPFQLSVRGGNARSYIACFGAIGSSSGEIEEESRTAGHIPDTARVADTSTLSGQNGEQVRKLETTDDSHGLIENAFEEKLQIDEVYKFISGGEMCPHPLKASTGGEDAFFIEGHWIGVADGVGGWMDEGINAGFYSRELMSNCALLMQQECGVPNPKRVLIDGVKITKAIGTCTAVMAALYNQTLYAVNIGDSGILVIRDGHIVAKSSPMQREFNFPYQVGTLGDDPQKAETYQVAVRKGDVVVLGTDGLYDNLYEMQIVATIEAALQQQKKPEEVAAELVKMAHKIGATNKGRTPFADAASVAGYFHWGGKQDDVTVVMAYVQ